jgi:sn-glycerol 3-phosphate transport system permease protein
MPQGGAFVVEKSRASLFVRHATLILGVLVVVYPVYVTFVASTHSLGTIISVPMPSVPGSELWNNYRAAFATGASQMGAAASTMLKNSFIVAVAIAVGKIAISLVAAFAIVFFKYPGRNFFFWCIFITLMLPVEVRIMSSYKVISDLHMIDTYAGLILPQLVSATAVFLFRQFFKTIPREIVEASMIDGSGPMLFFYRVLMPMSRTPIAAMFVIQFLFGWNQYLWPRLITNDVKYFTIILGINKMLAVGDQQADWPVIMATTVLAMVPPVAVIILMQKQFVKGMTETEK